MAAASVAFIVGALAHQFLVPLDVTVGWAFRGFIGAIAIPYVVVGATIRFGSPGNRIGHLLQTIGLAFAVAAAIEEYAFHGLVYRPGSVPGAIYAAWTMQWAWVGIFGLMVFVFLLFPNGRYLSKGWRRFGYVAAAANLLSASGLALAEGVLDSFLERPAFRNPLGIEGWTAEAAEMLLMAWVISIGASTLSLFIRYRRTTGTQRLQIKWLAMGALFTAVAFFFAGLVESSATGGQAGVFSQGFVTVGIALLPATIGVAILRYRLYDIDILINRALVYGSLSVALAVAYVGLVFGFQELLAPFTAKSDLAVAGSTLAVAALFRPLRARFQGFIDRRFYRQKFDAEQTVSEFSAHLRDQVDLDAITVQLTEAIRDTVQPTQVSVWLRGAALKGEG